MKQGIEVTIDQVEEMLDRDYREVADQPASEFLWRVVDDQHHDIDSHGQEERALVFQRTSDGKHFRTIYRTHHECGLDREDFDGFAVEVVGREVKRTEWRVVEVPECRG